MTEQIQFLVIGDLGSPPAVTGVAFSSDAANAFNAFAIVGGESGEHSVEQLEKFLSDPRYTCLPVADFSGAGIARADFTADTIDENAVEAACKLFRPLLYRIGSLPAFPDSGDRNALLVLTAAVLRNRRIEADWTPERPELVSYPVLLGLPRQQATLEQLNGMDLLRKEFFDRVHLCRSCKSSRLNTREECEKCRSSQIREASLVHHFNCAYQGPETEFQGSDGLVCPKCKRRLRHYGVDYDKPGFVIHCLDCHHQGAESVVGFRCADCGGHTPAEVAETRDWYHYSVSGDGEVAVRRGRLPYVSVEDFISGLASAHSPRSFALLAHHHLKLHERYERPVTAWLITPTGMEEMHQRIGLQDSAEVFRLFVEVLDETLRLTDAVTTIGGTIAVVLPETDIQASERASARFRKRVETALSESLAFEIEVFDGGKLQDFMELFK
jgi:hypothetical protein